MPLPLSIFGHRFAELGPDGNSRMARMQSDWAAGWYNSADSERGESI